jgi:hypothetical protein
MALLMSKLFVRSTTERYFNFICFFKDDFNRYLTISRNNLFGLTQSMFANHLEMIVERGFPLLRRINEILASLRDMGLMSKLFEDFQYNMTILTSIREMKARVNKDQPIDVMEMSFDDDQHKDDDDDPEIVLTTEHLEGAFTLLIAGITASFAVFVLEVIHHSKPFKYMTKWVWRKVTCSEARKNV